MYYTTPLTPQIADTNMARHIDSIAYPLWFDRARTQLYREMNPSLDFSRNGLVIVKTEVVYLREVEVDDALEIRTWVSLIGTTSFEVSQELWRQKELCAEGKTILVSFDFSVHKSEPLTDAYRAVLEKYCFEK